ncbi:Ryncolin-1,Angiopoietin-1,Fibrinogen C domain-containing protein 1,Tenascin-N,Angiopoietin-related protein 7,Ficolin-3,Fibrinogen-like protein 1,Ficolin-1,Ficolin-1-B,Angiopoietin-4,Tenascin-R,Ryncolin-2,Fibrinogen C domain-containing protein 1-A,Microfibril-associated glycoprotein 4,Fibrinogen-like protein A,Ryncolin-3,Angiopoietin-2,Tenascin-X,Ficolin-2,Tenascin,Angiopoietin-related protein 2,Ryncolin-4,Techylectin-like protein [Mytilus edulis]|uniref:Fibrinogen C-terminal domain-containing protein n=1 Tax=Mytilus edulis TaxID=6550 RepID=A0A8S3S3W1_MYTED|nr:Ryncolin-1,Angiopoietin-1,Fibrinogen C domain-containing protein 1,Tenascin-N,Angiopoietin-related protein 7,Ficolin-3,Fibrinogen-like protein 1,Ficolin-1,Ficolin-1-B,Angiopoietin-4,Tenascin-R,Ryncolin-2,Fibrinogen C domain-containing protein 1-A,Microfibril-associated glycoprotein 4,Fibrinogen-like protein A,Ryncolin-3,Angiopoietin-2,Tenascin-X,Ficolin-2,Tenascin,Angiopoietin-related protein 2,Ryncolin-4,Techylectin-like protein [Mytilus edulis]
MNFVLVFINAIVVALMAVYVYQNERRMEEIAAKQKSNRSSCEPIEVSKMVMIKTISICVFFVASLLVDETTQEPGICFYGEEAWTQAKDYFTQPSTCHEGRPIDCNDIPDKCQSGVYKVFPKQTQGFDVYCEMNLDEGHWTVFQRRENGYVDFYRGWNEYKSGFGNPSHEFWLGNENLHSLTSQYNYEMRVDLFDFDGNTAFAKYNFFAIGDESSKFKLTANGYHGTAGNSMEYHNGHRFTTKDSDNDNHPSNCAALFPGAWWFNTCVTADLNGQYFLKTPDSPHRGVYWRAWKGSNYSLKGSLMMMRRI